MGWESSIESGRQLANVAWAVHTRSHVVHATCVKLHAPMPELCTAHPVLHYSWQHLLCLCQRKHRWRFHPGWQCCISSVRVEGRQGGGTGLGSRKQCHFQRQKHGGKGGNDSRRQAGFACLCLKSRQKRSSNSSSACVHKYCCSSATSIRGTNTL
jgi:hypothetical protein